MCQGFKSIFLPLIFSRALSYVRVCLRPAVLPCRKGVHVRPFLSNVRQKDGPQILGCLKWGFEVIKGMSAGTEFKSSSHYWETRRYKLLDLLTIFLTYLNTPTMLGSSFTIFKSKSYFLRNTKSCGRCSHRSLLVLIFTLIMLRTQ
jgi:hypothetical protein